MDTGFEVLPVGSTVQARLIVTLLKSGKRHQGAGVSAAAAKETSQTTQSPLETLNRTWSTVTKAALKQMKCPNLLGS